jgi:hypothetical protein
MRSNFPRKNTEILMYYCADISWPVSFTVSAWERVYATNCRENIRRLAAGKQLARGNSTQYILITAILLAQRLTSYWGNIVSLRMLMNLGVRPLRIWDPPAKIYRPSCTLLCQLLIHITIVSQYIRSMVIWQSNGLGIRVGEATYSETTRS